MLNYAFDHRRPALSSPPLQHSTRQHFYFFSKINVLVPKSGQFYGNHKKKESYTKCIHISTVKAQFWHPVNVSSLTRTTTGNSAENGEKGKLPGADRKLCLRLPLKTSGTRGKLLLNSTDISVQSNPFIWRVRGFACIIPPIKIPEGNTPRPFRQAGKHTNC